MRTSSLTPTHERIARAILNLERRHEPAFVSDLVRNLGYAAESSLTATLHLMERKGFLLLQGGGARGRSRVARLTTQGRMAIGAGGIPLLGFIPAGPLTEALQQADDFVEPEELFPYRDGDFLLRVKGDSMIGDGILDGDKVLLRPGVEARQGEIAAVLVGESYESTLKHIYVDKETVTLRASNPKYPDLSVPAESVSIAGVFRGLIRQSAA